MKCGDVVFPKELPIKVSAELDAGLIDHAGLKVTQEEATLIEAMTRLQSDCEHWHRYRSNRLTASNFGRVMKRKAAVSEAFLTSIFKPKRFVSKATTYGSTTESLARRQYMSTTGAHTHDCGLVINPRLPYLGASPDAKVCDDGQCGIVEIKCPYSARCMLLKDVAADPKLCSAFCLELHDDNYLHLKKTHNYWFQVQGQLLVTGAPFCDFVVHTSIDTFVTRVLPDMDTMTNLVEKLSDFYINTAQQYLAAQG